MSRLKGWLDRQYAAIPAFGSQASCLHVMQVLVRTLVLIILFTHLAACKQGGNGTDRDGREPGARVAFGVDLAGYPDGEGHADITIDDKLISSVRNGRQESVFLPKGIYRIRVSAEDFESIEKEISVQDSPTQTFHFTLRSKQ